MNKEMIYKQVDVDLLINTGDEIVRCKDCKYCAAEERELQYDYISYYICTQFMSPVTDDFVEVSLDNYCWRGKRWESEYKFVWKVSNDERIPKDKSN